MCPPRMKRKTSGEGGRLQFSHPPNPHSTPRSARANLRQRKRDMAKQSAGILLYLEQHFKFSSAAAIKEDGRTLLCHVSFSLTEIRPRWTRRRMRIGWMGEL